MIHNSPLSPVVAQWFKIIEDLRQIEDRLQEMGYSDQTIYILAARDSLERFPPEEYRDTLGPDATFVPPPPNLFAEMVHRAVASIDVSSLPDSVVTELLSPNPKSAKH